MISGCRFSSDIYKTAFWYNGAILEVGTPRLDFLLNQSESVKSAIFDKVGLESDSHYILYAPTFRKGGSLEAYNIDYKLLVDTLVKKFGGKWMVLCRLHPNLIGKVSFDNVAEECIDVTNYNDIQELLVISDMLITDFSSCMFDVAFMRKPCLLYASDYLQYIKNERDLYFDIKSLPFPLSTTNDELLANVKNFDKETYASKVEKFLSAIGTFESGEACEKIYDYLKEKSK
jgi:CDP-glycerol glycerophosphotransferase